MHYDLINLYANPKEPETPEHKLDPIKYYLPLPQIRKRKPNLKRFTTILLRHYHGQIMETLDKLKGSNAVVVVGVFKDAESDAAKEYVKAAAAIEDAKFVITSDENVMKGIEAVDGAIVMFKNFDDPRNDYSGDAKSSVSLYFSYSDNSDNIDNSCL